MEDGMGTGIMCGCAFSYRIIIPQHDEDSILLLVVVLQAEADSTAESSLHLRYVLHKYVHFRA